MPKRKQTAMTAERILKDENLRVGYVRDDGSCWWYAFAAHMNLYKPTTKRFGNLPNPTLEERVAANSVRQLLVSTHGEHISKSTDYEGNRAEEDFMGAYGGISELQTLASLFCVNVMLWDRRSSKMMTCPMHKWEVIKANGRSCFMNADDIRRFLDTDSNQTVHMSWSKIRDAHFDTLLTPERLSNDSKAE